MATFTFAAGNARGLRRLPLYLLGALATLVVPRTDRLWVFGSGIGPGEGALPLLRLARQRLGPGVRLVWLATTPAELTRARALGLDAVLKSTGQGLWLTMRARVAVVTHGLGDVNRFGVRGAFVVQLWHGIPLKRLHLDAPVALSSSTRLGRMIVRRGYQAVGRQIDLFPVASQRVVARVTSAFGVAPANVVPTGDPRDDVLLQGDAPTRRAAARTALEGVLGELPGGPVVMYAPTWRDGDTDPAAPDAHTWDDIAAWLERVDGCLILRSHPLGLADYAGGPARSTRVRLLDAGMIADLTPVLPAVDHLVTDYSSTAFDFALTGGTTVFLAADIATYLDSRGLYEPYRAFSGGRHVVTWQHALEQLDLLVRGEPTALGTARAHMRWLRDEHFDHLDGRATERVLAEIRHRVERTPQPPAPPGRRPTVVELVVDADRLVLELDPRDIPVRAVSLEGPRGRVEATVEHTGGRVRAEVSLLVTRWGVPGLALPSGDYRLTLDTDSGPTTRVETSIALPTVVHELFRAAVVLDGGGIVLRIGAPLTDDEVGPAAQRALRRQYLRSRAPREDAVYFESFYGRSASDNPLGIDRALAARLPHVRRYWCVADRSAALPDGAIPLVEYSREWWRVRASARVLVVNDWVRWTYRPRRGQHVLQTWHGTMLKRLALDRADQNARMRLAVRRQSGRWDALLAQNDYSARIFRTSYAFDGPIWQTGYPRNDVFADQGRAKEVRSAVGIGEDVHVVLYAPTWRDDRTEIVDYLDLVEFADRLPADHVLLVRGHSRTLGHGQDLRAERLIDVTSYPDVADLMLVADVLVTDYSSVMFDFAATGKPMVFYTPDLDHYADVLRGFYFDLLADAPGPVVADGEGLRTAIERITGDPEGHATEVGRRYRAWQQRFTPYDDGAAGERVVQRMIDEGWLG